MRASELRDRSKDQLLLLLREQMLRREELALLIRQKKAKNVKEIRAVRKDIARIRTVLHKAGL